MSDSEFAARASADRSLASRSGSFPGSVAAAHGRQRRLVLDTIVLGAAGAAAALMFTYLLRWCTALLLTGLAGYSPPGLPSEGGSAGQIIGPHGLWLVPLVAGLGGLVVGALTEWLAPEAEGHGTDAVVRAFHRTEGRLRGRVAPVKLIASAITIGSGGSAGREGPIALVAAGLGSWYATLTGRDARDRRLLLLVGAAAGLSAVFRSPIGTALLVIEVLYSDVEFEAGALLYATLGAIVAYALNGLVMGWEPLFRIPPIHPLHSALDTAWYIVLGLAAGIVATITPELFYRTRDMMRALPVSPVVRPAIGAFLTGLIALVLPQIIAGGYGWVQLAIDGRIALGTLAVLVIAKLLAMSLTVGSGGSGGVFAPTLYAGAMLGALIAGISGLPSAPLAIVGMAAVFAGAARVPIATLMMVTEMTGGYTLLVPAALAVIISYFVQARLSRGIRYASLYEAQVPARAASPAHQTQHLMTALHMLREQAPRDLSAVGELDLVALLRSGLAVDLPGERRLFAGALKPDSPVVGTTVGASGRKLDGGNANIVALVRDEQIIVPTATTVLQPGDRLVVVTSEKRLQQLRENLESW
ncbi:MAG TPA: chloride channel protein [Gemmatimonadaceae bacterium]|jgi:CIC family chloride channel protein